MPDHEHESLPRWQGKVDGFVESTRQRIDTLFEREQLLNDKLQLLKVETQKDISDLSKILSNLAGRWTIIVAIAAFIGTVVSSLLVATIIKIFLKP